ncbi:hypothetical protein L596_026339 [Steinernema carpocapsae]|uniref:Uncharacterized protein n=1 Tax=Steinernema carpocapsae TaxID=34508 RepID=A0A4U5M122_STECR|nr:hypothetical protein L596_026339 [Steinernema carpocapsae]
MDVLNSTMADAPPAFTLVPDSPVFTWFRITMTVCLVMAVIVLGLLVCIFRTECYLHKLMKRRQVNPSTMQTAYVTPSHVWTSANPQPPLEVTKEHGLSKRFSSDFEGDEISLDEFDQYIPRYLNTEDHVRDHKKTQETKK